MEDDALERYAATRDGELRNALVVRHLPLVKFVARKMSSNLPGNVELDDLVSWGTLGLIDAIQKFEPSRGHQFSTYAVWRIQGEIRDGLQRMEWAPKQIVSKVRQMRRVSEAMTVELGREPTLQELADKLSASVEEVRSWLFDDQATRVKPLDYDSGDSESDGGPQAWAAEDAPQEVAGEAAEIRARVAAAVAGLSLEERSVYVLYYRDRLTLREIASELGVSVSKATQTHTRLVDRVRELLAAYGAVA